MPEDGERLLDILCGTEPAAANNPQDEDHTTFWLVAADQFARRGIVSDRARSTALTIIDDQIDLAMHARLGMDPPGLRKRRKALEELRERITAPPTVRPGPVLKRPQPYVMDTGDVLIYPTCGGKCINPYFASKAKDRAWKGQDGWSAAVIVDAGRAFDFLAWYRPLTLVTELREKPALQALRDDLPWKCEAPGTCSPIHFKKMELETIGRVRIDRDKLTSRFGPLRPGTSAAINDISIANELSVGPYKPASLLKKRPTISRLEEIETD